MADPFPRPLRLILTASGVVFGVTLALVLLDVAADVRLPGAVRPALPWLLVVSLGVAITVLVGALGTPKRPGPPADPPAPPDDGRGG